MIGPICAIEEFHLPYLEQHLRKQTVERKRFQKEKQKTNPIYHKLPTEAPFSWQRSKRSGRKPDGGTENTNLTHLVFFPPDPGLPADEELRAPEPSVRQHGVLWQVCASLPGAEPHEGRGQSVPAALRRREPVRLQGDAARGRSVAGDPHCFC